MVNSDIKFLPDPENPLERWDLPVVASSPDEARRECLKQIKDEGVTLESVTPPKIIKQGKPQSYRCNYVAEGESDDDTDD